MKTSHANCFTLILLHTKHSNCQNRTGSLCVKSTKNVDYEAFKVEREVRKPAQRSAAGGALYLHHLPPCPSPGCTGSWLGSCSPSGTDSST